MDVYVQYESNKLLVFKSTMLNVEIISICKEVKKIVVN